MKGTQTYTRSASAAAESVARKAGRQRGEVTSPTAEVVALVTGGALSPFQGEGIARNWERVGPELWADPHYSAIAEHSRALLEELKKTGASGRRANRTTGRPTIQT